MNNIVLFNKENLERQMFSTIDVTTMENKAKLFNATENADVLANDCVGEKFTLVDAYIERIMAELDKKKIVMDDIKIFGSQICTVKVYPEITAKITVKVEE